MFPELTTRRPNKRSLRELVRGAVGTALEFATLGEATLDRIEAKGPAPRPALPRFARPAAPTRRPAARRSTAQRQGGPDSPPAPGLGGRERRPAWRPPRGAGLHRLSGRPSRGGPSASRARGVAGSESAPRAGGGRARGAGRPRRRRARPGAGAPAQAAARAPRRRRARAKPRQGPRGQRGWWTSTPVGPRVPGE